MKLKTTVGCVLGMVFGLFAADGYWAGDAGGNWSDAANWIGGVKPSEGATAYFTNALPAGARITIDEPVSVNRLHFVAKVDGYVWNIDGSSSFTLAGSAPQISGSGNSDISIRLPMTAPAGFVLNIGGRRLRFYARNNIQGTVTMQNGFIHADASDTDGSDQVDFFSSTPCAIRFESASTYEFCINPKTATQLVSQQLSAVEVKGPLAGINLGNLKATVSVGEMRGIGNLRFTGNGQPTLAGSPVWNGSARIYSVSPVFGAAADRSPKPALYPDIHLDATRTNLMTFVSSDGTNYVTRWNCSDTANYASCKAAQQKYPVLRTNAVNNLPVMDFGARTASATDGAYMEFNADISARTTFIVECTENFIFTHTSSGHFHASGSAGDWRPTLLANRDEPLWTFKTNDCLWAMNGVSGINPFSTRMSGKDVYDVIAVRTGPAAAGINTLAKDRTYRYGGSKIAEIIVYSRVLTEEEFAQTEAYLRKKWQGIAATDRSDLSFDLIFPEMATEIMIAPEAILRVGLLSPNRQTVVAGGRMVLERGAAAPVVPLTLRSGTLELRNSGIVYSNQVAVSPIVNPSFHLDASMTNTMVISTNGEVLVWNDRNGNGRRAVATNTVVNPAPRLVRGGMKNGLPYVDFGAYESGQMMFWEPADAQIRTAFLVFQNPGMADSFLLGDLGSSGPANFHRGGNSAALYSSGYVPAATSLGYFFVNGRLCDPFRTMLPAEPVVLTFSIYKDSFVSASAFAADRWVLDKTFRTGGQGICEVVCYNRYLPPAERTAVHNWLMRKWLPVSPVGYQTETATPLLGTLFVAKTNTAARIEVASNSVSRIGSLAGAGDIEKTGRGTIQIEDLSGHSGLLTIREGEVSLAQRDFPAPFTVPQTAIFHLDASDPATYDLSGTSVIQVRDASGGVRIATPPAGGEPAILEDPVLGGKKVIDFGAKGSGKCLLLDQPITRVRTAVLLVGSQNGAGVMLGSREAAGRYDYFRDFVGETKDMFRNNNNIQLTAGSLWVDGVPVPYKDALFNGGYQIVTINSGISDPSALRTIYGAFSAFCADRYESGTKAGSTGGLRLAEVLVFDRILSDTDRRDVEAYLRSKWLGETSQGYTGTTPEVNRVQLAGGMLVTPAGDDSVAIRILDAAGDFVKNKSGQTEIYGIENGAAHSMIVSNGTVVLKGQTVPDSIPQDGLSLHVDASLPASMNLETLEGTNYLNSWSSLVGSVVANREATAQRPYLLANELNGRPVVDFGPFFDQGVDRTKGAFLNLSPKLSLMKSVFMVLGTQNGGNFLVCTDDNNLAPFHRAYGATGKIDLTAPLIATGRVEPLPGFTNGTVNSFVDGLQINPFTTLPGGNYQTFAFVCTGTDTFNVETFARDRAYRFGGQRIAEYLVYNRTVTEEERCRIEAYLQRKWFARSYADYVDEKAFGKLILGGAGSMDFSGTLREFGSVQGRGNIANGTLRVTQSFRPEGTLALDVLELADGVDYQFTPGIETTASSVVVAGGGKVTVTAQTLRPGRYRLVSAASVSGSANLKTWTVEGLDTSYLSGQVKADSEGIYLETSGLSTLLILR